jgi:hypothetical protein
VRGLRDRVDQHVLTLARPAAAIKVREILELAPPTRTPVAADLLEELRRCELERAGDLTFEELAARSGDERVERPEPEMVEEPDEPRRGGGGVERPDLEPGVDPRPATER